MNAIISLFVALLWAIGIFANKKIIFYLNSPELAFCFISIIVTIMCIGYVFATKKIRKDNVAFSWRFILVLLFAGIIGSFLPNILFFHLIKNNPPYLVTALTYTTPVLVLLIAIFIYKEKVNIIQVAGVFLVVIGVFLCLYK
jgi:drug/metabolite transporter (DMT)-like permease